ncbi:MAG: phenylacetate--CoA ligase family protein [Candidatus Nanohaloarchaea archaeon]
MEERLYTDYDIEELLPKLDSVVSHARKTMEFYGDEYQVGEIDSITEFRGIPTIDKDKLPKGNFRQSSLVFPGTSSDARYIITTSGTTGDMTIVEKSEEEWEAEQDFMRDVLPSGEDKRVLVLFNRHFVYNFRKIYRDWNNFVAVGKPHDIDFTTELALSLDVDTLIGTPSLCLKVGEILQEEDFDTSQIEDLGLVGGILSPIAESRLQDIYPEADITQWYANAEASSTLYQCEDLDRNTYHMITDYFFFEVLDPESDEPVGDGEEGELVVTPLWRDGSTPLLRYRTGDRAEVRKSECGCEKEVEIELKGRLEFDQIKLKGISVYRGNFEDAIEQVSSLVKDYRIHVREEVKDGEVLPRLEVEVYPAIDFNSPESARRDIKDKIENGFQVTERYTWKDGMEEGIFLPLKVSLVDSKEDVSGPKIVDHRGE